MDLLSYKKTLAVFIAVLFGSNAVVRFIARRKKKELTPKEINEVIIFSESSQLVPSQYRLHESKVPLSLNRILYHLDQCRYTLDICMYVLNNRDISIMIQKLHYKGVKVRFIVDFETAFVMGSEVRRLHKNNVIQLRWKKCDKQQHMHHKFCLIDASAEDKNVTPFLMNGSLNWTNVGIDGNWESVLVTSEPDLVRGYKEAFEELWLNFGT